MNAWVRHYGDEVVNSYREADHQIDKLIDALGNFMKEPEFHAEYKEKIEYNVALARRAAYELHMLESLIIEMEGDGYGD